MKLLNIWKLSISTRDEMPWDVRFLTLLSVIIWMAPKYIVVENPLK